MDDVVIDIKGDRFSTRVTCLEVFKHTDKKHRTFAATSNVAGFASTAVQRPGLGVFFLQSGG